MKSQKWALYSASKAVNIVAYADNMYRVSYPWRDIDGPKAETSGHYYAHARALCANYRAYYSMLSMGYDKETATWATEATMWRGSAKQQLAQACRDAGPIGAEK
ncbi:MAG: hypothetical protein ACR2IJ_05125 [Fluviibacter sp.]